MKEWYLGLAIFGLVLFLLSTLLIIWSHITNKKSWKGRSLLFLSILGPATLGLCWNAQVLYRVEDALFWSRLMSGDTAQFFWIGSIGLIVGSALAMGGLSLLSRRLPGLIVSAIAVSLIWWVVYLHPTPHYVPVPPWLDKLVWFLALPGGAIICLLIYWKLQPKLSFLQRPLALLAALVGLASSSTIVAFYVSAQPLDLSAYSAQKQIKAAGCLSCHTMNGLGYPDPGGGLESVASRKEDTVRAFLKNPTAHAAREFGIRENPTGEMAGLRLTDEQINQLVAAMKDLFEIKPPSKLGPGFAEVEQIMAQHTCFACHTYQGEGAPEGGIGGPFENAARHSEEVLVQWLMEPTFENAQKFEITETPTGAMTTFALPEDEAKAVAEWIKTLKPEAQESNTAIDTQ